MTNKFKVLALAGVSAVAVMGAAAQASDDCNGKPCDNNGGDNTEIGIVIDDTGGAGGNANAEGGDANASVKGVEGGDAQAGANSDASLVNTNNFQARDPFTGHVGLNANLDFSANPIYVRGDGVCYSQDNDVFQSVDSNFVTEEEADRYRRQLNRLERSREYRNASPEQQQQMAQAFRSEFLRTTQCGLSLELAASELHGTVQERAVQGQIMVEAVQAIPEVVTASPAVANNCGASSDVLSGLFALAGRTEQTVNCSSDNNSSDNGNTAPDASQTLAGASVAYAGTCPATDPETGRALLLAGRDYNFDGAPGMSDPEAEAYAIRMELCR